MEENENIIQTDIGAKDGQNKCPKCGATDISLNVKTGMLRCNFCRHQFEPEKFDVMEQDIANLTGEFIGSGASDISENSNNDMITLKCTSCGAEVVIDTASSTQARCHWCRNTLSINEQIPNGAVPDTVLPFSVSKKEAAVAIEEFVGKRKFYANPKFKKEFSTENIMGVYLPYMIVDANVHSNLRGQGEIETRRWSETVGDSRKTYYDADLYNVERDFDLTIEGLTVESSKDKLEQSGKNKTNNIINAIMPFDTENCVKWDSNYIKGYTSEKRDVNIENLKPIVNEQCKDIARYSANDTLKKYDRGVRWDNETMDVKGRQWKSAYLPVWLYSYLEKKGDENLLHYVAVNARTKETMGSVPVHKPKLFLVSLIVEFFGLLAALLTFFMVSEEDSWYPWLFLLSGIIYYFVIYGKYRNTSARHCHESETKSNMLNLQTQDVFVESQKRLDRSSIEGANNKRVSGTLRNVSFMDKKLEDIKSKF